MSEDKLRPCPFTFKENGLNGFDVIYTNGKIIGEVYQEVHAEYVFLPVCEGGYWTGWGMRMIGEYIENLNTRTNSDQEE